VGTSLIAAGEVASGLQYLDHALALYDPDKHRLLATRFGQDPGVVILSYRSWALWRLGYPKRAVVASDQALKDAREFGPTTTVIYALWHAALTQSECRNYTKASAQLDEAIALANERGAFFWRAMATLGRGCIFALSGDASKAVQMIISGMAEYKSTGATAMSPVYLSYLATAYSDLGQFDDARRCVGEAMADMQTHTPIWYEAEVCRMAGEISLNSPKPNTANAEAYFERAVAIARRQQTKSYELRASMSLARLWRSQGKVQQARELLAPVYGWFTEGFDTRDLKEAKALLEELAV
jgi:predicted ATPase